MEPEKSSFIPDRGMGKEEMKQVQREIGREAVFHDSFDFDMKDLENKTVVGIDQAFTDEKSVSTAVVIKEGNTVEEVSAAADLEIPYIPGLLAFREGKSIVEALRKLDAEPDLLMLDGSGRIHFREAGIAMHIGVIFDTPAVGIAKNLLCGTPERQWMKLEQGEKIPVKADNKVETSEKGETIGYVYQSKQYEGKRKINPLYVSPGHMIGAGSSVKAVKEFVDGYKLPEPTRIADKRVSELKKNF